MYGWFPIGLYGWEPTFESQSISKQVGLGWHLKQIEEWLLLSSKCAVVCSYCMSHQHLDAKIVNISHRDVPIGMYGWDNPYQSRYARGGI